MRPAERPASSRLRSLPTTVNILITGALPMSDTQKNRMARDGMAALPKQATAQGGFFRSEGIGTREPRRGRALRFHARKWRSKRYFGPLFREFSLMNQTIFEVQPRSAPVAGRATAR